MDIFNDNRSAIVARMDRYVETDELCRTSYDVLMHNLTYYGREVARCEDVTARSKMAISSTQEIGEMLEQYVLIESMSKAKAVARPNH